MWGDIDDLTRAWRSRFSMVDGTVSMVEGLGYKAIDSNELRRKQKNSTDLTISPQIRSMIPENPSITSKLGFEAHRAKSSPARNLQQALLEESLILEAKERASHAQGESAQFTCQSSEVTVQGVFSFTAIRLILQTSISTHDPAAAIARSVSYQITQSSYIRNFPHIGLLILLGIQVVILILVS